jgi:hypothetical protein
MYDVFPTFFSGAVLQKVTLNKLSLVYMSPPADVVPPTTAELSRKHTYTVITIREGNAVFTFPRGTRLL